MNNDLVSVIIPIYNCEKYVEKCIMSVLEQSYSYMEVVLVDDGSTDSSYELCKKFLYDSRIQLYHKDNGGVSSARNYGIEHAKGEYIFFVDSDDWVDLDYIKMLKINADFDFVQGGCRDFESFPNIMNHDELFYDFANYWFKSAVQFVWGNCYKKEIIIENQIRFDENISIGEDARFNIEYLKHVKKIKRVKQLLYHHINNSESLVHRIYYDRLKIEREECKMIESVSKNQTSVARLKWYFWHVVLTHFYTRIIEVNRNDKSYKNIKKCIIDTYKDRYFRSCIPYIKKYGSIDEKIEANFMGFYRNKIFKKIINILS